jgi:hypothetical protein
MAKQALYKVVFVNHNQVYELYARQIFQSDLYGFIEIEDYVFGEKSSLIVDTAEEKLKTEFADVKRSFIPMHAIVRIDEVEKEGPVRMTEVKPGSNVTHFPFAARPMPGPGPGSEHEE